MLCGGWVDARERERERERREKRERERKGGDLLWTGILQKGGFGLRDFFGICASCALTVSSRRRFLVVLSVMEGEGC